MWIRIRNTAFKVPVSFFFFTSKNRTEIPTVPDEYGLASAYRKDPAPLGRIAQAQEQASQQQLDLFR
jgi:hypothetical protein